MRRSSIATLAVCALLLNGSIACRPPGKGGKTAAGKGATSGLVENLDETAYGPNGKFATIGYRGGPKESMVIADCAQCSGSWSDEVLKENDGRARFRPDDPPVEKRIEPAEGVDAVPVAAPTWCKRYSGVWKGVEAPPSYKPLKKRPNVDVMWEKLQEIAWMSCDRERYAPRQRQIANMLQAWLNLARVPFERVVPVLEVLAAKAQDGRPPKPPPSGDRAVDALAGGCYPMDSSYRAESRLAVLDTLDLLEGADKLAALDRAAAVCRVDAGALAILDIRKVDHNKAQDELEKRLDKKKIKRAAHDAAQIGLMDLRLWTPIYLNESSEDPQIRRFHGERAKAAEAAAASWKTNVRDPNKATLSAAFEAILRAKGPFEEAKGCSSITRPLFEKLIKAKATTKREELDQLLTDPVVNVVFQADALCNAIDNPLLGAAEIDAANRSIMWFGPRRAAVMAANGVTLKTPDKTSIAEIAPSDRTQLSPVNRGYSDGVGRYTYEIRTVTPKDDELVITAAGKRWVDPTYNCYSTGQIERIRPDGYLEYKEECQQVGAEAKKLEYAPMLVPKDLQSVLTRGAIVVMMLEDNPQNHAVVAGSLAALEKQPPVRAHPIIVYANDKANAPVTYYFGVKLP